MLQRFRRRIGLTYSRFHFRRDRDRAMNFTDSFASARRALVLYPETPLDPDVSASVLKYLARRFATGGIVVVIREDLKAAMSSIPWVRMVTYDAADISPWFIPRKDLMRRLKGSSYDIAVDLNTGFALPSAFLCKESKAPLRVGFSRNRGDNFYNCVLQTKLPAPSPASYRALVRCLDMFS